MSTLLPTSNNSTKKNTFYVEHAGYYSDWKKQTAGIRQGCTLSPYLFLILMTAVCHDVDDPDPRPNSGKTDQTTSP